MLVPFSSAPTLTTSTVTGLRAALVDENNVVQNVIVWDNDDNHVAPEGLTAVVLTDIHSPANIGWTWAGGEDFLDPNPPEIHVSGEPTMAELQAQVKELQDILEKAKVKLWAVNSQQPE
jgi:hypothetical protein